MPKKSHRSPSGPIAKCQINLNHKGHEVSCPTTLQIGLQIKLQKVLLIALLIAHLIELIIALLIALLVELPMKFLIWWRSQ